MSEVDATRGELVSEGCSPLMELEAFTSQLNPDELAIVCQVAHGLALGREVYGRLSIANDYASEASKGVRKVLVYLSAQLLRLQRFNRRS